MLFSESFKPELNKLIHGDCMEGMKEFPDKFFDLAITDPEYGLNSDKPSRKPNKCKQKNGTILNVKSPVYEHKNWDSKPASEEYFKELKRVSKEQIIWGVNYYDFNLSGGRLVWDKLNGNTDQFDCEIAYVSMNKRTDVVYYMWSGMFQGKSISKDIRTALIQQGNKKLNEKRIHPTQKPAKLYKWILNQYTTPDMKIISTHVGSGSDIIAFEDFGCEYIGYEIDKDCFDAATKRIKEHKSQKRLF